MNCNLFNIRKVNLDVRTCILQSSHQSNYDANRTTNLFHTQKALYRYDAMIACVLPPPIKREYKRCVLIVDKSRFLMMGKKVRLQSMFDWPQQAQWPSDKNCTVWYYQLSQQTTVLFCQCHFKSHSVLLLLLLYLVVSQQQVHKCCSMALQRAFSFWANSSTKLVR